jgi:hypothetical protein
MSRRAMRTLMARRVDTPGSGGSRSPCRRGTCRVGGAAHPPGWRPAGCRPVPPRTAPGQAGWPDPATATAPSPYPRWRRATCSRAWPGRPGLRPSGPPRTARRLAESTLARDQSSSPAAPSSSSSSSCSRSNTPASAHSANRRQQVVTLPQPNSRTGSSAHGVEVRAMNKIAAMQARSDTVRGAPPPGVGEAAAGCAPTARRGADDQGVVACPSRSQGRSALVTRTSTRYAAPACNHSSCLRECPLKDGAPPESQAEQSQPSDGPPRQRHRYDQTSSTERSDRAVCLGAARRTGGELAMTRVPGCRGAAPRWRLWSPCWRSSSGSWPARTTRKSWSRSAVEGRHPRRYARNGERTGHALLLPDYC